VTPFYVAFVGFTAIAMLAVTAIDFWMMRRAKARPMTRDMLDEIIDAVHRYREPRVIDMGLVRWTPKQLRDSPVYQRIVERLDSMTSIEVQHEVASIIKNIEAGMLQ